jgi:hypothetical protein
LLAVLWNLRETLATDRELRILCGAFIGELTALKDRIAALSPRDRGPLASADTFAVAHRYAVVLAAAACLGIWYHNPGHPSGFIRDDTWVIAALSRLARRLGRASASVPPDTVTAELLDRYHDGRSFDLVGRRLAGHRPATAP